MSNEPTYGASFFASLFDVTDRHIQQLAKDGVIPKNSHNQYPLLATVKAYVNFIKDSGAGASSDNYKDGRARIAQANAEAKEIDNKARAALLYEKNDTDQKVAEAFKVFQQSIMTLPDVAERDAGLNSEQVKLLIDICDNAMEQLSESFKNLAVND